MTQEHIFHERLKNKINQGLDREHYTMYVKNNFYTLVFYDKKRPCEVNYEKYINENIDDKEAFYKELNDIEDAINSSKTTPIREDL